MVAGAGVQWGIAIPQIFPDGPVDMGLIRGFVTRAEALGYHSLWVQEHIEEYLPNLEPLGLLGYAAALTRRAVLGTSVLLPVFRNPVHLAKSIATLDQMAGGRLVVGVGLGAEPSRYPAFGIPPERRVRQFDEGLRVMRALWTQEEASYQGQLWSLERTPMQPKPLQRPGPPLWFGGRHPQALRRAVLHADGWMGAGGSSTATFRQNVADLRRLLEEVRRDPATFPISKRVYLALDPDRERAHRRLREWFGLRYRNADMADSVAVYGGPQECVDRLAEVVDAGAGLVLVNQVFDHMEHLESLWREVVPAL